MRKDIKIEKGRKEVSTVLIAPEDIKKIYIRR